MEFRRLGENEIDSLVKMRLLYLQEDFTETTDEQFSKIEKIFTVILKNTSTKIYMLSVQWRMMK